MKTYPSRIGTLRKPGETPEFMPSHSKLTSTVRTEKLGGEPINGNMMKSLRLPPTLSEVNRTDKTLQAEIEKIIGGMTLPSFLKTEALSIADLLPRMKGVTVRERAVFCIYVAGKRQREPRADITSISRRMLDFDTTWVDGRATRSIEHVQEELDPAKLERIWVFAPTPVEAYIRLFFSRLEDHAHVEDRLQVLKGLRRAYPIAIERYECSKKEDSESDSRSPRIKAAHFLHVALKRVDWKDLHVRKRNIIGAEQIAEVAEVSMSSFIGHS